MKIDIVCLLYQAENYIDGVLERLKAQKGIELGRAVFPITESETANAVAEKVAAAGYEYFFVKKEEFSHSLTREKAIFEYCENEVVVMLSQDAVLFDENSIAELAKVIDEEVVYAYGRQICRKKTIEHYVRQKNYGDTSETVSQKDVEELQLHAFFASDAFSAYHRPTFLKLNGYDNLPMMMSEDMYYAKKVIDNGYKKGYAATAVVEHSHKFTLKQLYDRYYATGVWFGEHKEFDNYKTTDSGMKLALHVFKSALKDFNIPVLFRFLPDMTSRYLGMRKGKKAMRNKKDNA